MFEIINIIILLLLLLLLLKIIDVRNIRVRVYKYLTLIKRDFVDNVVLILICAMKNIVGENESFETRSIPYSEWAFLLAQVIHIISFESAIVHFV